MTNSDSQGSNEDKLEPECNKEGPSLQQALQFLEEVQGLYDELDKEATAEKLQQAGIKTGQNCTNKKTR